MAIGLGVGFLLHWLGWSLPLMWAWERSLGWRRLADACCGSAGCRPWRPAMEATTSHGLSPHGRRRPRLHQDPHGKGDNIEVRNPHGLTWHTGCGFMRSMDRGSPRMYEYSGTTSAPLRAARRARWPDWPCVVRPTLGLAPRPLGTLSLGSPLAYLL